MRLLEATGGHEPRQTSGAEVLPRKGTTTTTTRPSRGAATLVLAGEGRPMRLEGLTAVRRRAS